VWVVDEFEGINAAKDEVDTSATSALLNWRAILIGGSLFSIQISSLGVLLLMYQNTWWNPQLTIANGLPEVAGIPTASRQSHPNTEGRHRPWVNLAGRLGSFGVTPSWLQRRLEGCFIKVGPVPD
jgi:hypothetical protein